MPKLPLNLKRPSKLVPPKQEEKSKATLAPVKVASKPMPKPLFEVGESVIVKTVYTVKRVDDTFVYVEDEAMDRVLTFRRNEVKRS